MKGKSLMIVIPLVIALVAGGGWYYFLREKPIVYTEYTPGEHFVSNIKDSRRLIKVSVVLKFDTDNKKFLEERVYANSVLIRETIIFILRELDEDTINNVPGFHVDLCERIRNTLNDMLNTNHIVAVNLNDFVMQ